mgnify:CR=1 FL=1|jgi:conserved hypothetical protein, ribA/ribD-fused
MFTHDTEKEKAYRFSRHDTSHLLSPMSPHPIELEGETWASAEHYFQAQMVANPSIVGKIKSAKTPEFAFKLGSPWYRRKHKNWKALRRVMMSRALYTKVQMYPAIQEELVSTGDQLIIEASAYDHYWGIGRDQRGDNMLGKVWMDIRRKLAETSETQHNS